ncbi:MAG: SurA N-terminal domain-containing protein [Desulfocapsaceae bacterium]|nr:SurA N-terminal domain-containing protein [Desulfocapsaceae bacterium]
MNIMSIVNVRCLFFSGAAILLFLVLGLPGNCRAELVDRVVAVVNDDVITMSEVNEEGKAFFQKITEQAPAGELSAALRHAREEVLSGLIDKKLIAQEAAKQKVTVNDAELEAALKQMIADNNMSPEQFREQLRTMGMTESVYRDNLRNQILQSKLLNYEVRSKIIITDDMILDYYDTHYTKQVAQGGYYLLQMGFVWKKDSGHSGKTEEAAKLDAKKRAERVRSLVESGQDFSTLAKKFSELPSAADGGNIGTFQREEMADYMRPVVTALTPGQVSQIVETPDGYQFFKLLSSQDGGIVVQAPYESVKEEIRKTLYDEKLKEEFGAWVSKIKEAAYIKRM